MFAGDYRDSAAVLDYLCALKPAGPGYGVDRMRLLAPALGGAMQRTPVIHVAGTNGKGSVAAMLEAILRAAGWRVGLYTSPHLVSVGERVQVDRVPLTEAQVVEFVRELDPVAENIAREKGAAHRPSFFEFMTAMAFLHFARSACDVAVMEVGLGGEFDATNVVDPEVTVITSIGLDHAEYLGATLASIARAKAGIIKPHRPLVLGRVPVEAEAVIRERAAVRNSPVSSVREVFGEGIARYPQTRLVGDYQRWNAATAMLTARLLDAKWRITPDIVREGLARVEWAGRWDVREIDGRVLVLDAAHNPEGAAVLDENLAKLARETNSRPTVVVGVLGADRARPLLAAIARHAGEIHLVVPDDPRACSQEELEKLVPRDFSGAVVRSDLADLFPEKGSILSGIAAGPVVVTGSIYLCGAVLARLARRRRANT